ncbi:Swc5p Ecym_2279 [Eremothecium cymbalariae DBVPG|uniref:SWR1-complex protein 5 n=1 Tax=Eremothecium cymbalariae (strain CBS 270.75 / DBVPG 7215 / KCTC 17166 / NRRL Y-17582) TaxID=931890 RepID=G8JPS0_ERECY|nr:Hypothetical protein Ecym_2279 [Eremothecium cymbalariae DBVPG\
MNDGQQMKKMKVGTGMGAVALNFDEEEYDESLDEDYDPTKAVVNQNGAEDDDRSDGDGTYQDDDDEQEEKYNYSKIESEYGGLISTRAAKKRQDLVQVSKYEVLEGGQISPEVEKIWQELKLRSDDRSSIRKSIMANEQFEENDEELKENQLLIDRTYKFAGEVVREKRWVPKSSAEAQEYLSSLKFKQKDSILLLPSKAGKANGNLQRPLKRPPILEQIIAGSLKPKLTTLEKSKLDWATYVDKEGINDELQLHNKDGYLAKQDFLNKVQGFKDDQYKEMRSNELKQRIKD